MKAATLEILKGGTSAQADETILVVSEREVEVLFKAVHVYASTHKRDKLAKKLLSELLDLCPLSTPAYDRLHKAGVFTK